MKETFQELKERIISKRSICEKCWKKRASQLHHCLVHDMKRYHKILTVEENLMPVCEECHTELGLVNGIDTQRKFAIRQIEIYGLDIVKWYQELPLKFKEQWLLDLKC